MKQMRAITMYSAFNPVCGLDNSTIIFIGHMYCPNTKCLGKICLHKTTFQSRGKSDYQCPQCRSVCQVRNILLKIKQIPLLVAWSRVYIFEASPKSFQDVIGDVYCLGKYCSSIEKCESLGGYVKTPRSIYACGKKVWSLVVCSQSSFHVTRALKVDKNRQNTFFLC